MPIKREQASSDRTGEAPASQPAPETTGRLIRLARHYDTVVNLLALGRAQTLRQATIDLARIQP